MENVVAPEPQWILDKTESGPLFWRRDSSGNNPRVKFKYDVEVKEFCRGAHEMEDPIWAQDLQVNQTFSMGMTCLLCIAVMVLPWYIMVRYP